MCCIQHLAGLGMNQLILAGGLVPREEMVKHDVQFMYVYLSESNHRGRKQASGSALSSMEAEAREESLEAKEVQRRCSNLNEHMCVLRKEERLKLYTRVNSKTQRVRYKYGSRLGVQDTSLYTLLIRFFRFLFLQALCNHRVQEQEVLIVSAFCV